jgi:ectoine hydroxylase-related dioxygenase (phytanoyl-CoA dioxygenase family)
MPSFVVSDAQVAQFKQDGYLFVENLFDQEEMDLLLKIAKADQALAKDAHNAIDSTGGYSRLALRNELHDDLYSAIVRCPRVVDTMERVLEGEVYHYHHKMMLKEPFVGGAWEWHQDYGYWYNNGCLYPDMASCMIAVDRASKENGCLQVIKGSHLMGRIEHGKTGSQTGADMERVEKALERLPLEYCEMEPGTALFFHSNLLHRSDKNLSPNPRWALICCYNTARNNPYKVHHHPCYSFLEKWPDERVKEIGRREWEQMRQTAKA